ncbi:MAG: mercury resistance system transport protein MerF [Burkholderiaceae bacterium]
MFKDKLLATGVIGTIVVALCCFTPVLFILLGVVGLGAMIGYADYVLMPGLVVFIGITIYALWRRSKRPASA